jgi:hypothetical protein
VQSSNANNKAVLSIVGALIDYLSEARLIDRVKLAQLIEHAAVAHEEEGDTTVADTVRWLTRALLDDETLSRMTVPGGSLRQ